MANRELPDQIRDLPLETKVEVLYERVKNLDEDVSALKRALWAFVASIITGALLFLLSVAAGWLGPRHAADLVHWLL